jgi:cupin fold WbuC family metalloprotein
MMPPFRKVSDEVYYTERAVTSVGPEEIDFLKARAAELPRRRSRLCAHPSPEHGLHEMLIVHGRDAYVRPHRHHGKPESLHVIEGRATALLFGEDGGIERRIAMGPPGSGACFFYRIESAVYHSLVIESDWLVFHEATSGPFDPAQTEWAPWSPDGKDETAAARYLLDLRKAA